MAVKTVRHEAGRDNGGDACNRTQIEDGVSQTLLPIATTDWDRLPPTSAIDTSDRQMAPLNGNLRRSRSMAEGGRRT